MIQTKNKAVRRVDLLTILAVLIVLRLTCPALSNLPIFTIAFTYVYGVIFLGLFFISYPRITKSELKLLVTIAMYTLIVGLYSVMSGIGLFSRDAFNAYLIVFLLVIFMWLKRQTRSRQVGMMNWVFTALIFDYIYSIWVLVQDPNASRTAAALGVLEASPYDVLNAVGSFDLVYGSISIITIMICVLRGTKRNGENRLIPMIILGLSFVFVIMSSYATAFFLLILSVVLVFGSLKKPSTWLMTMILLIGLVFHEAVGQWIMDTSSMLPFSAVLRDKIRDVGEMLKTLEAVGTYGGIGGRAARLQWSFETFLEHPILGGYFAENARIGGHSEWMDTLGKYGLLGFSLIITFFVLLYQELQQILSPHINLKKSCRIIFFVFALVAITNPSLYALQIIPLVLILPLSVSFMESEPQ